MRWWLPCGAYAEDHPTPERYVIPIDRLNFHLKIMHQAWHPTLPIMALAAVNNLYLFRQ
jgi:hypothetical protein